MVAVSVRKQMGPETYFVSTAVTGGTVVEWDTTTPAKVRPAGAASTTFVGIALDDANPAGTDPSTPLNFAYARPWVAVAKAPLETYAVYAAAATFGTLLVCAANGQVTPIGAAALADARSIVGWCSDPNGVGSGVLGRVTLTGR